LHANAQNVAEKNVVKVSATLYAHQFYKDFYSLSKIQKFLQLGNTHKFNMIELEWGYLK
jgi:hypothetical protein